MNILLTVLLLLNLYLPAILNQGTEVRAYVSNPCGPINNAYLEFRFNPGGEIVKTNTDENGMARIMGPKANVVTVQVYGLAEFSDVTSSDNLAEFSIFYSWC